MNKEAARLLMNAFAWSTTEQGGTYWSNVYAYLQCNEDFTDLPAPKVTTLKRPVSITRHTLEQLTNTLANAKHFRAQPLLVGLFRAWLSQIGLL